MLTPKVKERFAIFTKKAAGQFTNDLVKQRLQKALDKDVEEPAEEIEFEESDPKREIHTTQEELEGYFIVKTICREVIDPKRIAIRDTLSYCGILFDDNNRKPICRLHFNTAQEYIVVFDEQKKGTKVFIDSLDDIVDSSERIKAVVSHYANSG